jgi:hypothetical protein
MSRTITKPEDAIPRETHPTAHNNYTVEKFFTIAECAQIARVYAEAVLNAKKFRKVDISANQEPYPDDAWRAKFKQWENES